MKKVSWVIILFAIAGLSVWVYFVLRPSNKYSSPKTAVTQNTEANRLICGLPAASQMHETATINLGEERSISDIKISEGETVQWVNNDSSEHHLLLKRQTDGKLCDTFTVGQLAAGGVYSFTFTAVGTWIYSDPSDARITGQITVGS